MRTDRANTHLTFQFIRYKISLNQAVADFSPFGIYYPKTETKHLLLHC